MEPIYQSTRLCQRLFTEIARAGATGTKNLYSKAFIAGLNQECKPTHVGISAVQHALAKLTNLDAIYVNSYGNYLVSDPLVAQVWLDESQQADDNDGTVCDEELA